MVFHIAGTVFDPHIAVKFVKQVTGIFTKYVDQNV